MRKKGLIKSCLLGSALLLGTGYTLINNKDVSITGTVSAANYEMDVEVIFETGNVSTITKNECKNNVCSISFELNEEYRFTEVGEVKTVATVYINSYEYNVDVKLSAPVIKNDSEFFNVIWAGFQEEYILSTTKEEVLSGESTCTTFAQIDVFMVKLPITEEESTATFTIEFTMTPVRKA